MLNIYLSVIKLVFSEMGKNQLITETLTPFICIYLHILTTSMIFLPHIYK